VKTFLLLYAEDNRLVFLDEESTLQEADLVWGRTDEVLQSGARYTASFRDDLRWDIAFLERNSFGASPVVECPIHFDRP